MKQVLHHLGTGDLDIADVPRPQVAKRQVLIRTHRSLISQGTERILLEFGRANLLNKARQQPERVRQVLDKIKVDGLLSTIQAVKGKLDQPIPLGYCNMGEVLEIGEGVQDFQPGDRVISNGSHAEVVAVPENLCVKVPDEVPDEEAVFTVLAAIALQGMRLAEPTLGESFVVTGLGMVGLLAVQLLKAQGCRILGIDIDPARVELARRFGAKGVDLSLGDDPVARAKVFSRGRGVDGVIIAASTDSNEPIDQAAKMCRKRARIVLIGVVGMELKRPDFYEKELTFQVSSSYGPGRYDPEYEEGGHDYPVGHVRWTAQRNFEAVLDMLAEKRIDTGSLTTHRIPIEESAKAYELLKGASPPLGIMLTYGAGTIALVRTLELASPDKASPSSPNEPVVGVIGAGSYAVRTLIPALRKSGARLKAIASISGASSALAGKKFGFESATTDADSVLADPEINAVVIATRHDSHAQLVCQALEGGKHLFVEKPLAIHREELTRIEAAYDGALVAGGSPLLMVGFNRRFAPMVGKLKRLLSGVAETKSLVMTVNAGELPREHWIHDPAMGGRIIGEGCHFVDLLRFLVGQPIVDVGAVRMGSNSGAAGDGNVSFTLRFADGSIGAVHYLANGHPSFPKERLEVFCGGRILQLDNFRRLRGYGWPGFRSMKRWRQDKGNVAGMTAFVRAVREGDVSPIPFAELTEVTRVTFDIAEALRR